jgi:crotonobetainyl-CoA:carnitine CoA-transferase CaiB-like acyl-CoA transferase
MEPLLEGVKVVELAEWVFAPATAAVLRDWGADVVKIEHPERGDSMRGILSVIKQTGADTGDFNYLVEQSNRGKRSIGLDLRQDEGRALFLRLIEQADVFVTSLLEPSRRRLGITWDDLSAINPRLIYARGTGFGQKGPDADSGAIDAVAFWARGGVGSVFTEPGRPLMGQRQAFGDYTSAMFLAGGVAAALYRRSVSGRGGLVDVSLFGAATWMLSPDILASHYSGVVPNMGGGSATTAPMNPLTGHYRTADDRIIILGMIQPDPHWPALCKVLELGDDVEQTYDSFAKREHVDDVWQLIRRAFAAQPLAHWRERFRGSGCVWMSVQTPPEVPDDPQAVANGYVPAHPTIPRARLVASPVQYNDSPVEITAGAPELGQHTEEVLLELGLDWPQIVELKDRSVIT